MFESLAMIYDSFTDDIDYDRWEQDINGVLEKYSEIKTETVADLACGTGSITWRLAKRGYKVTGIDISEEMLFRAGENMRRAGVSCNLVKQDISAFKLHKKVDAVVCACDGVNYLTKDGQLKKFFHCCAEALKPRGVLVFDVSSEEKLHSILGNNGYFDIREDACVFWQNSVKGRTVYMELGVFIREDDGRYVRKNEVQQQRMYSTEEIEEAAEAFEILDVRQVSYDQNNRDKRLQFVCRLSKEN